MTIMDVSKDTYTVKIEGAEYDMKFCPNYNQAKQDELFLIESSGGSLEISLKNQNANE
ncbi:MAG: hypothetical protein JXB29_12075 [Sedimentisphaerales bacterium]|nr:hypothetical protein [Sedimentisphaerales bacterium]